jgi:SAM-dependent methyltransferase
VAEADDSHRWLDVLAHNGFENPERWVSFARRHGFRPVRARRLERCPDCGDPARSPLGSYVYYSTFVRLQRCRRCDLLYADAQIDPELVRAHFEGAYKDAFYFDVQRRPIFEAIAGRVAALAPSGARVLDVGGARGDLLAALRELRPDLALTLADVSEQACALAERRHGLRALRGSARELLRLDERFELLLLIDVAYYEADIRALWQMIDQLVAEGGAVVARVPNRSAWIRATAGLRRLLARLRRREEASIPFFNPEHVFAFSRRYLRSRLAALGFDRIDFLPSPPLHARSGWRALYAAEHWIAAALHRATCGALAPSPSLLVVARRGTAARAARAPGATR